MPATSQSVHHPIWIWICLISIGLTFCRAKNKELLLIVRPLDNNADPSQVRALHLSRHAGCLRDIDNIWRGHLGVNIESVRFQGPLLMTGETSKMIWDEYKTYWNKFDIIITSDTAPISRIFLSRLSHLQGRLIVYVSNRFDTGMHKYHQENSAYISEFYHAASFSSKMEVISYSEYDVHYMVRKGGVKDEKNVTTIYPLGDYAISGLNITWESSGYGPKGDPWADREQEDLSKDYTDTYFFSPYQNEQDSILRKRAREQGINFFLGYTNDTRRFKAQVIFPVQICNYASFESIQRGVVAIMPSKQLMMSAKVAHDPNWPYELFGPKEVFASENPQYVCWHMYPDCRIYFDSWEELFRLLASLTHEQIDTKRQACAHIAQSRRTKIVAQWKNVLNV